MEVNTLIGSMRGYSLSTNVGQLLLFFNNQQSRLSIYLLFLGTNYQGYA
jgi:hypothetical protein